MGLEVFGYSIVGFPQRTILFANICEKHWIVILQHFKTVYSGDLLNRWTRHTHDEMKKFFFGPITIVRVLMWAFDTESKNGENLKIEKNITSLTT
jgi:hypothetical protein